MAFIKTISESEAQGELAELYRLLSSRDGKVDDAFKVLSLNPKLLSADAAMYRTIMYRDSPLSRSERELLALTVSRLNGCERCVRHHSTRRQTLRPDEGTPGAGRGEAGGRQAERERALIGFAEKLTKDPGAVGRLDVERLRRMGLDDRAILDACNVVAYFNYANRVTLGLGIDTESTQPEERLERDV